MKEAHGQLLEVIDILEKVCGEDGCPWVKAQTAAKHIQELKKELAEVESALQKGDNENLAEELGDVLWDILMLIRICEDEQNIDVKKSLTILRDKMIRRRPYLFGEETAETAEDALRIWNRVKAEEKKR